MICGKPAFHAKSQASLIATILKEEPPPLASLEPGYASGAGPAGAQVPGEGLGRALAVGRGLARRAGVDRVERSAERGGAPRATGLPRGAACLGGTGRRSRRRRAGIRRGPPALASLCDKVGRPALGRPGIRFWTEDLARWAHAGIPGHGAAEHAGGGDETGKRQLAGVDAQIRFRLGERDQLVAGRQQVVLRPLRRRTTGRLQRAGTGRRRTTGIGRCLPSGGVARRQLLGFETERATEISGVSLMARFRTIAGSSGGIGFVIGRRDKRD
jgi:hypothetical protein